LDAQRYREVTFKPLTEPDIATVYFWLQQPHVHEFYHTEPLPPWEKLRADYLPRVDYRVTDYPAHAALISANAGISIDLFIGDIEYFNKGWGRIEAALAAPPYD
jgi:hypothetical protein